MNINDQGTKHQQSQKNDRLSAKLQLRTKYYGKTNNLFRDKGHSSKRGAHLKTASANGNGQLPEKTKYPLSEKVGMPSGILWVHSDHRLMDILQRRFNG
jgi:hypothetical protein